MIALEKIREAVTTFLSERNINAMAAWPAATRERLTEPVAVVSVKQCRNENAGFRNYLGRRFNEESNGWEELYGRKLLLTLGIDIYTPAALGGGACQSMFATLTEAFQEEPAGIKISGFSRGETAFQEGVGLFYCPTELECLAYLYVVADEEGEFLDFEVKGVTI